MLRVLSALFASCVFAVGQSVLSDGGVDIREPKSADEAASLQDELPRPAFFDGSAGSTSHFGSPKQASTWLGGPETGNLVVQTLDTVADFGKDVGTSPWHMVSPRQYGDSSVTVWGSSLTDAYRLLVDGDRFEFTDRELINIFPISVPWNLVAVDNGNVIVPDPDGHLASTSEPTLLVLNDALEKEGRIRITQKVEVAEEDVRAICGVQDGVFLSGSALGFLIPTFTGELAATFAFEEGGVRSSFLVVLDEDLVPVSGGLIGATTPTNDVAAEPVGADGTAFYVATDQAIVKMLYEKSLNRVSKSWERALPVRGRVGTTPTLMNTSSGEKFVCLIDAKAAVITGLDGVILYDTDTRPSALVAVRREDAVDGQEVITTVLPDWLGAVENSPAVRGDYIAIPNYSGYLPNGLIIPPGGEAPPFEAFARTRSADAVLDFATGVVVLKYDAGSRSFVTHWQDPDTQLGGVVTISGGSNMLYGTGSEEGTQKTYFYGYRLEEDGSGAAGEMLIRQEIGDAPFRTTTTNAFGKVFIENEDYKLKEGEVYDAGNNLLILEDGSAIVIGGRTLVRVRDRFPPDFWDPYFAAVTDAGLTGDDTAPGAMPFKDGVTNLEKFAYNMDLGRADTRIFGGGAGAGLPSFQLETVDGECRWTLKFLRRRDSVVTYAPRSSSDLGDGSFTDAGLVPALVNPVDDLWESVEYRGSCGDARYFLSVAVGVSGS